MYNQHDILPMLQAVRARPNEAVLVFQRTTKVHWDPGASPAGKGMRARPHAGHCGRGRRSPMAEVAEGGRAAA